MFFDNRKGSTKQRYASLNPFRTGRCFSTRDKEQLTRAESLNPFRTGRCFSTYQRKFKQWKLSYVSIPFEQGDVFRRKLLKDVVLNLHVSIPFEQGDVFRLIIIIYGRFILCVSIPFEQGDVFRQDYKDQIKSLGCLNPFRTGRCFSTLTVL